MRTRHVARWAGACTRAVLLSALAGVAAADATPYQRMAPLEQYLMPPDSEIALARSAAPAAISDKATVLTLDSHGYQTAVHGINGFTCLVERSWMSPFESPGFWNPKMRVPSVCWATRQRPASRSSSTRSGGRSSHSPETPKGTISSTSCSRRGWRVEFPLPEPGAMSFMMSKDGYLGDDVGHWHPHLMFHVPKVAGASWGANLPGSPVVLDDHQVPEPETVFLVPVSHWSDGTTAAPH